MLFSTNIILFGYKQGWTLFLTIFLNFRVQIYFISIAVKSLDFSSNTPTNHSWIKLSVLCVTWLKSPANQCTTTWVGLSTYIAQTIEYLLKTNVRLAKNKLLIFTYFVTFLIYKQLYKFKPHKVFVICRVFKQVLVIVLIYD